MAGELSSTAVAQRLRELRSSYRAPSDAEARAFLDAPEQRSTSFPERVGRRLQELRALQDLTDVLHRVRPR